MAKNLKEKEELILQFDTSRISFAEEEEEEEEEASIIISLNDITELKQAEAALRESEQKFKAIFDYSGDGIMVADPESKKFRMSNNAFCQMLGYSQEEIKNLGVMDIHPKEDLSYVLEQFEKQINKEIELSKDIPMMRKDGSVFYADIKSFPIVLNNKKYLSANFRDITLRQQSEAALRESEQKFKAIFNSSLDGIVLVDIETKKYYIANNAFCEMLGYNQEEIKNLGTMDIHTKEDLPYVLEQFEKQMNKEIGLTRDIPVMRKDGSVFSADIRSTHIMLGGRKYLSSNFRDSTERKKKEEELVLKEQLLDSATDSIFVCDLGGNFIYVNEAAYKTRGYSKEAFMKLNLKKLDTPEYAKILKSRIQEVLENGSTVFETAHFCIDGSVMPVEVSARIIKKGGQKLILGSVRDMSERKKMQRRLLDAEKMATVGKFVAGAAHELNNPLAGIIGFSDLALRRLEADKKPDINKIKKQVIMIADAAERCKKIVANLLSYGRKIALNLTSVDINKLIDESLTLVKQEIDLKDIKIVKQYSKNIPKIMASKDQLPHVFINIIRNAWRFTQKDKLLKITTEKEGDYVKIVFNDNGEGIKKEHLSRVFDPFFTTREVGKGTGLGLSVSLGIIKSHGGEITVDSEGENKGATFTIRLPISVLTEPRKTRK